MNIGFAVRCETRYEQSFSKYKRANNGFIGILAKNYNTYEKHYFTQDRMVALKEWMDNPIDVSFSGIYDNSQGLCHYGALHLLYSSWSPVYVVL